MDLDLWVCFGRKKLCLITEEIRYMLPEPIPINRLEIIITQSGNSYTRVNLPVRGDNPQALVSGLSPIQVNKPCFTVMCLSIGTPKNNKFGHFAA